MNIHRVPFVALLFFAGFLLAEPRTAGASQPAPEDLLADGEIDAEDIASARTPLSRRPPSGLHALAAPTGGRRVLGAPSGSTWLSLVGFAHRTLDDRREVGGFLVLGLPLDRFARSNTRVTTAPISSLGDVNIEPASAVSVASALGLQTVAAGDERIEIALTPRLARACVTAAWRTAGLGADDARVDAILSRARWSAALPEARLRAVRFEDAQLSLDTGTETSRLRDTAGANVGFEARLTWRFDRLVYADDEPSFERIRLEHRDARSRIAAKVLEALFHWQRATLDLRTLSPAQQGTRDEADAVLRVMESEAALDVLTNGWFATHAGGASRSARGSRRGEPEATRSPASSPLAPRAGATPRDL